MLIHRGEEHGRPVPHQPAGLAFEGTRNTFELPAHRASPPTGTGMPCCFGRIRNTFS